MMTDEVDCPKGGRHVMYSEIAHPSRIQYMDWCTKCGIWARPDLVTPTGKETS